MKEIRQRHSEISHELTRITRIRHFRINSRYSVIRGIKNYGRNTKRLASGLTKEERKANRDRRKSGKSFALSRRIFSNSGNGLAFRAGRADRSDSECRRYDHVVASFYILVAGVRYGVPKITLLRMAFNIGLDYLVGTIPFFGDAFDFFWKSNKQNMDLIRERATGKDVGTTGDYIFVIGIILLLILLLIGSILVSIFVLSAYFFSGFGIC